MRTRFATYCKKLYSKEIIFLFHVKYKLLPFIHKTVNVSHLRKPDDTLIIDYILYFHNAVLLSCLLNNCMHACVFRFLFKFELAVCILYKN